MSYPRAFIFDLDGTLVDSMPDLETSMNEMLTSFSFPTRTREQLLSQINCGAREFVARSLTDEQRADDALVDRCLERYQRAYAVHCNENTAPYPGMVGAVTALRRRGAKIALCSNKDQCFCEQIIEKLFPGLFDTVLGSGRFPTKPDPAGALWIAGEFGVEPGEVAYVGDSDIDMKTAVAAGFLPVAVSWGYRPLPLLVECGARRTVTSADDFAAIEL